ncbi:MAG: MSHA biogenesis protein MshQ [Glaciecola sp.]|jgi:MSHA biogenesis protein MshQ
MKRAAPKKSKLDIKSIVLTTFISIVIFANVITVAMATPQSNEEYYNELFLATHISQIYSNQDVAASNVSTQNYSTTPYRITGHRESITEDEDWSWDGYYITEWRAAMENPAFFGTNGVVTRSIEAVNLSSLNASSLSTVDAFVATWWSVSDSSPFHGDIINFFLSGGDLVLMQDYTTHDGIGTALGIETTNGMTNPSSVSSPLQNGPFGAVSPFTINDGETHFSNSTIISLGGTICGVDGAGRATIACWERGQFSEGAGKLVIINDTEFITTINNEATYNPLNNKGRLALNLLDFLVRPLAADHYRIEHDGTGLTCEAESVTIKACANAKCTLLYDQTSHLRLSPSGWANGDNITFTGSTTAMLNYNNVETIRLSETLTSPDAPLKCFIGNTESCDLSFMNSSYPLVKTIEISSAVGSFLQVSEVVAWGASSNSDLALNTSASVSATGFYQGNQSCNSSSSDASCVLNGVGAEGWPNIYHSNSSDNNEILTVTLDIASDISSIEVFGRNNCCAQRDIYNIRLFDEQGVLLEEILSASANNSNNTTGAIALSGSVCVTNPDHYRIEHDGQGLTCQAEPVVIKACANSDCSELYSQPTTLTLIPSGWEGGDTLSFTGATSTTISHTTVQTITLGKLTATPEANMKCVNGVTETCNMDFVAAGFRFLNTSSGVSETITNQISGTNFPLRLQAVLVLALTAIISPSIQASPAPP